MHVNQRFDEMLDAHRNEEPAKAIAAACDVAESVEQGGPSPYGFRTTLVLEMCYDVARVARARCDCSTPADLARLAC